MDGLRERRWTTVWPLLAILIVACGVGISTKTAGPKGGGVSPFYFYLGAQALDGNHSYLDIVYFDPTANTYSFLQEIQVNDASDIPLDTLRAFSMEPDGTFLLGGSSTKIRAWNPVTQSFGSAISLTGAPVSPDTVHGLCVLPNGHLITAPYNGGSPGAYLSEYDANGSYVSTVYQLAWTMSNCHAVSNTLLYAVDYDGGGDNYGTVREFAFSGTWSQTDSFNADGTTTASLWSIVYSTDGYIYLPPQNPETSNIEQRQMLRCKQGALSSTCAFYGDDITVGTGIAAGGDQDLPQAAFQIPGSTDLLIVSNQTSSGSAVVLRFDTTAGHYTVIPPKSAGAALPADIFQVRNAQL